MRNILALHLMMFLALGGCAAFGTVNTGIGVLDKAIAGAEAITDKALDATYDGIEKYCERAPENARAKLREEFNSRGPHKLIIECASDVNKTAPVPPD